VLTGQGPPFPIPLTLLPPEEFPPLFAQSPIKGSHTVGHVNFPFLLYWSQTPSRAFPPITLRDRKWCLKLSTMDSLRFSPFWTFSPLFNPLPGQFLFSSMQYADFNTCLSRTGCSSNFIHIPYCSVWMPFPPLLIFLPQRLLGSTPRVGLTA